MAFRFRSRPATRANAGLWIVVVVIGAIFAAFLFWDPYGIDGYIRAPQTPAAAPDLGDGLAN